MQDRAGSAPPIGSPLVPTAAGLTRGSISSHPGKQMTGFGAGAPDRLQLRSWEEADLDLLAHMNRELIEDERHPNPMTPPELRDRFLRFAAEGWTADLFLFDGEVVGYALHRREPPDAARPGSQVHLCQFFVARDRRRQGIGRRALAALVRERWQPGERIVLDVLEANPGGKAFWIRAGFDPYYTRLGRCVAP